MSKLCDGVIETLRGVYPHVKIKTEQFVQYQGQKLFLDIYVPALALVIEVHGRQHDVFVDHFHGSSESFRKYRQRDRMKEEWAALQGLTYVVLREHQLPISSQDLLRTIQEEINKNE